MALTGLDRFVASFYGTHQVLNVASEEEVTRFAAQQQRLSEKMPERSIAVCVDEAFHPAICIGNAASPCAKVAQGGSPFVVCATEGACRLDGRVAGTMIKARKKHARR